MVILMMLSVRIRCTMPYGNVTVHYQRDLIGTHVPRTCTSIHYGLSWWSRPISFIRRPNTRSTCMWPKRSCVACRNMPKQGKVYPNSCFDLFVIWWCHVCRFLRATLLQHFFRFHCYNHTAFSIALMTTHFLIKIEVISILPCTKPFTYII